MALFLSQKVHTAIQGQGEPPKLECNPSRAHRMYTVHPVWAKQRAGLGA